VSDEPDQPVLPKPSVVEQKDGSKPAPVTISTNGAQEIVIRCVCEPAVVVPSDDEDRKATLDIYKQALEGYDRTIVTISSGALALSITFLHDVVANASASSACWLWWGWGGLLVSLAVIIISMLTGHVAIERYLADKELGCSVRATTALNIFAAVALLVGFGGLAVFAKVNMFGKKEPTPAVVVEMSKTIPLAVSVTMPPPAIQPPPPVVQPPPAAPAPKTPAPKKPGPTKSAH